MPPRQKTVYCASDDAEFDTADEARRHDRGLKLKALEGLTSAEILDGINDPHSDKIRDAIVAANNMVQEMRKKLGVVKPRRRPGDRPPQPAAVPASHEAA